MFDTLKRVLSDLVARQPDIAFAADDPRVAVAALMSHVVAVDGIVSPAERTRLIGELVERYGLAPDMAHEIAEAGRMRELESATLQSFTAGLERRLDIAERRAIVTSLWKLAFADGEVHEFEDNVVWRIADLLGVPTHERTALRKQVQAEVEEAMEAVRPPAEGAP
jgi:uncharacterized tellurite resistance protein B-like protein